MVELIKLISKIIKKHETHMVLGRYTYDELFHLIEYDDDVNKAKLILTDYDFAQQTYRELSIQYKAKMIVDELLDKNLINTEMNIKEQYLHGKCMILSHYITQEHWEIPDSHLRMLGFYD